MLNDIASNTSFFGIFITGVAYVLACEELERALDLLRQAIDQYNAR